LTRLTYADLIRELFPRLTGGIRWGLDRTRRMLAAVGDPQDRYPTIHIGGTNGKGSVSATIANILKEDGRRVGLYTSPHLCTFRERIQIDGQAIGESDLVEAATDLWPAIEVEEPSFFEATTAIAFHAMHRAGVEIGVIEVGLGGRLDATNVILPQVSVVTNVALDHLQLLGDTIVDIAREKAGIFKAGIPAVTAETGDAALCVFRERSVAASTTLRELTESDYRTLRTNAEGTDLQVRTATWGELTLHTPLPGRHQAANTALAAVAVEMLSGGLRPSRDAVERGTSALRWPGRLQIETARNRTWVFDVAHNVAGVQAMGAALAELPLARPLVSLVGVLGDKDWRDMLGPIYQASDAVVLTLPPSAPSERRWDPDEVLREMPAAHAVAVSDFPTALAHAEMLAGAGGAGTVLVTGSFHTVGDALILLGMTPFGVDPDLPVSTPAA
jgi:dihydrofolate synthase / folylpolyglutamate synthase